MLAFCKMIPARNWLEIPCNECFSFWNLNRTKSFKKERHQEQNIKTTEYNFKAKETNTGSKKKKAITESLNKSEISRTKWTPLKIRKKALYQ